MRATNENVREQDRPGGSPEGQPREGPLARVQSAARDIIERVRKALGSDDDTHPPGFNGLVLLA